MASGYKVLDLTYCLTEGGKMKLMYCWKFLPGCYQEGMKVFLETGAPDPEGDLKTIGRWHAPGSQYGFHLVEGDPVVAAELSAQWSHLVELEATPVIDDEEAKTALRKVF